MKAKLYTACTPQIFDEVESTDQVTKNDRILKLDAKNHRVALNAKGVCSIEQFGTLKQAKETYNTIRRMI